MALFLVSAFPLKISSVSLCSLYIIDYLKNEYTYFSRTLVPKLSQFPKIAESVSVLWTILNTLILIKH